MRRHAVAAVLLALSAAVPATAEPKLGCQAQDFVNFTTVPPPRACPVARPGIVLRVHGYDGTDACMSGFLLTGSDRSRYLGMDAYCLLASQHPDGATIVFPRGRGFVVETTDGARIGEVRYARYERTVDAATSFALVRLDPRADADPAVHGWGGPTGIERGVSQAPADLLLTGSLAITEAVATLGMHNATSFNGVVPPATALGSPVLTAAGKAVGVSSASSLDGTYVNRIEPLLRSAEKTLKIRLTLRTAKLAS